MTDQTQDASAYLENLFRVVLDKAKTDKKFAKDLIEATGGVVQLPSGRSRAAAAPAQPPISTDDLEATFKTDPEAARKSLTAQKVPDLKAIAGAFGLTKSGAKAAIINRIITHLKGDAGTYTSRF